jgi:hypothetical protein
MKHRVTPSLVIAVIAVFLACAGGATAASKLITGKGIKDGSITGADLKGASIGPSKLSNGVVDDIQTAKERPMTAGPVGPAGPMGPQGAQGPAGPSVVNKITRVTQAGVIAAGVVAGVTANCPSGQTAVSGGAITAGAGYIFSDDSFGGAGWSVLYDNYTSSVSANVTAVAYCAPTGQAVGARSLQTAGSESDNAIDAAVADQRELHHQRLP